MSKRKKLAWSAMAVVLLFLAAISVTNLARPHSDIQSYSIANTRADRASDAMMFSKDSMGLASPGAAGGARALADRKLIHNAELGLTVTDVRAAADQIQRITEAGGGEVENLEITGGNGFVTARLVVRVPASGLVTALAEYKKLAIRTDREQITGHDVTREFYDNEAHLRSLRAEEEQYLTIMKQAHKVPDVLDVAEKLSDVRDRIERLQSQIQVMSHDIEMSAVEISLNEQVTAPVSAVEWRPWYNAKAATHELLVGLGAWMDWVVQLLIELPLFLLWTVTIGGILWTVWKMGRAVWRRIAPKNAGLGTGPAGDLASAQPVP